MADKAKPGHAGTGAPAESGRMHIETEMTRDLGLVSALAIGVGTMIAAGIFTLSGLAVAKVGSSAIIAFGLAAIIAGFTALTYCEFTSIYPESGEGYLYARKTFAAPFAYMVGWCLVLGYTSSCGFYIASFASYFNEFIWHVPMEVASGLVMLAGLTLLNMKGTKESGGFQVVVTITKVVLLIWFVFGGLPEVDTQLIVDRFSGDLIKIGGTAALVFVTFFGFSAIAASAGEVINPKKTIPRAIFISMGIVSVLYVLVVAVVLAANLSEYTEAAMGTAAERFLGPIGGMVIVGGALFSMVSASNASIMAGSRVALSMSMLGHLPREIGTINPQTRTPVVALLLTGTAIGGFAIVLPLESLANFANCVLLVALILVNYALIAHRRKFPDIERPFRVPLVPLLPGLGIAANFYLLSQITDYTPVLLAAGALVAGFLGFLVWKGWQAPAVELPGVPSKLALERAAPVEAKFRVLIPIANPATVEPLVDLAATIAERRHGEIIALRVIVVPEQLPLSQADAYVERERHLLELARNRAQAHGVPITSMVRIAHHAARAILETAEERNCDLIVIGWKGHTSTAERILGDVTDDVVRHARTDIMLVRLGQEVRPAKLLVPTGGGGHAQRAEEYAVDIARVSGGSVTLCRVVSPDATDDQVAEQERWLAAARARHPGDEDIIETRVIRHDALDLGIIQAADDFDAIAVGATRKSFSSQIMFGSVPEAVATRAVCPVIVVKRHQPMKALVGRVMSE
jgi:amino acid transporter/nucleotide-binding universal stress UspA family protein